MDRFTHFLFRNYATTISLILLFTFVGIYGYFKQDRNLFPDADRPQIAVIISQQGASAKDIAQNIAIPVERELYTIDKVRTVSSFITDGLIITKVEFEYGKNIAQAFSEVDSALSRVKDRFPEGTSEPSLYKIASNTYPIIVYAVYSKDNLLPLEEVRYTLETDIKKELIKVEGVERVEIFGGYKKEIQVLPDIKKMTAYGTPLSLIIERIRAQKRSYPIGFLVNEDGDFLIKYDGTLKDIDRLRDIHIRDNLRLGDIAEIRVSYPHNFSIYYGNGKRAIAVAIQRSYDASALDTIRRVKERIKELRKKYPNLIFEITDTQENIIALSISNMFEALRDAIIFVSLVIFVFLANLRQMIIAALSIPFVYAITVGFMWMLDIQFNIVTLTGIILALGMLVDDAVVVLENIERHLKELGEDIKEAVFNGTREVMLSILGGTVATSSVLIPLIFVGDYPQRIFRPLAETLIISLWVSYFVSITFIPLVAPFLLRDRAGGNLPERFASRFTDLFDNYVRNLYIYAVKRVLYLRGGFLIITVPLIVAFFLSMRLLMPLLGGEMMPPMDTGIVKAKVVLSSGLSPEKVNSIAEEINRIILSDPHVRMLSLSAGAEPGVLSFPSSSPQTIYMTITYSTRFERDRDIWSIQRELQRRFWTLPYVKYVSVFEYGATPMSNIKGSVDVMVSGERLETIDSIGQEIFKRLHNVEGLKSVERSWDYDKLTYAVDVNVERLNYYGLSTRELLSQLSFYVKGIPVTGLNVENKESIPVRLVLSKENRKILDDLEDLYVDTPKGKVPLSYFIKVKEFKEPTLITRQGMSYTLDIVGYREKMAITHLDSRVNRALENLNIPEGVTISKEGEGKYLSDSVNRMFMAVAFGIFLLFLSMVPTFGSFSAPLGVVSAIPLAVIGGIWALFLADYHRSLPAMMGLILLSGIIVKNSILLIDFINKRIEHGADLREAILESIRIRTRPVMMTAFATSAGMIPIAMAWALGLERLAPLAVVTIGGLILGTFLTLIYVPVVFYTLKGRFGK